MSPAQLRELAEIWSLADMSGLEDLPPVAAKSLRERVEAGHAILHLLDVYDVAARLTALWRSQDGFSGADVEELCALVEGKVH